MAVYLDTSALVKLVVREAESAALRTWLGERGDPLTTSVLGHTELIRAVRRVAPELLDLAHAVLDALYVLALPPVAFQLAAGVSPAELRSLDALHVVGAQQLGDELTAFVSYDLRLAAAASAVGMPVAAPA